MTDGHVLDPVDALVPPPTRILSQFAPHMLECLPDKGQLFDELWTEYYARHGDPADPNRVLQFMYLLEIANKSPAGDYIEIGTHKGLTARLIHKLMDPACRLYLLDTYEGFVEKDLVVERKVYSNAWHEGNFIPTSPEYVASYVGDGSPPENVTPVKGWFPETYAGLEDKMWRFVHIDVDLYQPIKTGLALLWPKVVPGGVVVVHDYGCYGFPGAKIAVDEFADSEGLTAVPLLDRWGSAVFIKPKPPVAAASVVG